MRKDKEVDQETATSDDDVFCLNVGDRKMHVKRRTLKAGGGLLEIMFSGRWDENLSRDSDGNVFLDHRPEVFEILISFLRDKAHETPSESPVGSPKVEDDSLISAFYQLVNYYGLTSVVYQVCICSPCAPLFNRIHADGPHYGKPMNIFTGMQVSFDRWYQGVCVPTNGNVRRFDTFEIVVGNCKRLELGWAALSGGYERGDINFDNRVALCVERSSTKLVRHYKNVRELGVFPPGTAFSKGSVIRVEGCTKLFVDGKPLCLYASPKCMPPSDLFPYLGLEGDAIISAIEFST